MAYNNRKNLKQLSPKSEYYLSPPQFLYSLYFAYQYQEFKDKLEEMGDGNRAVNYDAQPHGESKGTALEDLAIKRAKISARIDLIEQVCRETDPGLYFWLLKGVTSKSVGYGYLRYQLGMPCGRNYYYKRRRQFYHDLYNKLEEKF